jgi:hydroxymethylglutaryl-CoA synthase
MSHQVGIEAIALAVPQRYIDIEDLARARGVEPAKFTQGLGALEMSVPEPGEDTVALAATAASRLIESYQIDPGRIGMVIVGTETGVDHSKATASYVQGLLGLPKTARTYDTKHACYGGTAALLTSASWIASGAARGKAALVICSDIARYGLHSAGEPTQGGGAVAMLISEKPSLFKLDHGISGIGSSDVHDFWRPLDRREALVDGHYSIQCYLDSLSGAYRGWRQLAIAHELIRVGNELPSEALSRILYHVPFCKMAKKAHAQLRRCDHEDAGHSYDEKQEAPRDAVSFQSQVASSLGLCARVGNIYTGSLYLSLMGLLHAEAKQVEGRRIGMFSYGSGYCGEFFSGVIAEGAASQFAQSQTEQALKERRKISIAEYEEIMSLSSEQPILSSGATRAYRFLGSKENRRTYASPK